MTPPEIIETSLSGRPLLNDSFLNKGSAFPEDERRAFELNGLLPIHVSTMDEQLQRTYGNYRAKENALEKYIFLAALHDRNETLFYRLIQTHIAEMVPIVYTPTVGEACQRYSHIFRRARGLYLSYADPTPIEEILARATPEDVQVIVVTDGERILGLGDLGAGGMGIPVGKLALYTLCAGIHPRKTLPVLLDAGTNNLALLNDPLYLGWRHPRLDAAEYDRFVDRFVEAVRRRWPRVVLQWEDFAKGNASRLLERWRGGMATFNDDIQGTAAVALAGLYRAMRQSGAALRDQRTVIIGAGSAATGIARLLRRALREEGASEDAARESVWLIDSRGLVHDARQDLSPEKAPFAQRIDHVRALGLDAARRVMLESVVEKLKPTVLLGVSGQPGLFTEAVIRRIAAGTPRPVIFPLSNPNSKAEAMPEEVLAWSDGRALIATGSPFPPALYNGRHIAVGQCNNSFIFPGVGLGLVAAAARTVPEEVFLAAAKALAGFDRRLPGFEESLFPNLDHVRQVSREIALVVAREIVSRGLSHDGIAEAELPARIESLIWEPAYPKLRRRRVR